MNKIALVSGANKGIGLETSRQLAQQGVLVILAARDPGRGSAACAQLKKKDGLQVESIALDVTSPASIAAAAKQVEAQHLRY